MYSHFKGSTLSQETQKTIDSIITDQMITVATRHGFTCAPKIEVLEYARRPDGAVIGNVWNDTIQLCVWPGIENERSAPLEKELRGTIAHECYVFQRIAALGWDRCFSTLHRALVTKGLANHAQEWMGCGAPVGVQDMTIKEIDAAAAKLRHAFAKSAGYHCKNDYARVFAEKNQSMGYNLSHILVWPWLHSSRKSVFEALATPAEAIPAVWREPDFSVQNYLDTLSIEEASPYLRQPVRRKKTVEPAPDYSLCVHRYACA